MVRFGFIPAQGPRDAPSSDSNHQFDPSLIFNILYVIYYTSLYKNKNKKIIKKKIKKKSESEKKQ